MKWVHTEQKEAQTADTFSRLLPSSQVFSSALTDDQIDAIMDALDADGDGTLSYDEFLTGFSVVDTSKNTPTSSTPSSPPETP